MEFEWEGRRVEIKRDISLTKLETFVGTLWKLVGEGDKGFYLKIDIDTDATLSEGQNIPTKLIALLEEFKILFHESNRLLPQRDKDHKIWS